VESSRYRDIDLFFIKIKSEDYSRYKPPTPPPVDPENPPIKDEKTLGEFLFSVALLETSSR